MEASQGNQGQNEKISDAGTNSSVVSASKCSVHAVCCESAGSEPVVIIPSVPSFYVENFGCRATQADGAALERQLSERGLVLTSNSREADLVVLNTCTVTAAADQDVRSRIRNIYRNNPNCRILVTGCYAQRAPQELASLPGVSWVVGNSHKHQIGEVVAKGTFVPVGALGSPKPAVSTEPSGGDCEQEAAILVGDIFAHTQLQAAPVFGPGAERTRPNLKVQDGCDNRCSFCVIPSVRGQSRSLRMEEVLHQVEALVSAGYREVVISGINLGRWGRDLPGSWRFEDLVRAILEHTRLEKLRISSVEPMDWSEELIRLMAESGRIARHAHVPMQSGSDAVLRRMHRKYRPWHYAEKILRIHEAVPEAAIGADVMVDFPGESEAEFGETVAMVQELPLTYLHVFTFSARPGTAAASMGRQVGPAVARERNRILREIASAKKQRFMESFVGHELPAIILSTQGPDWTEALTDNYLKLRLAGRHEANQWVKARIVAVEGEWLTGSVTDSSSCAPADSALSTSFERSRVSGPML
jgi:threonylcarbamoyladenosine tRNA methylthiotransferase MtaB